MHDAIFSSLNLAGIDRHCAARINDNDATLFDRLRAEFGLLLVHRGATQIRNPMVQEIVGLRLEQADDPGDGRRQAGLRAAGNPVSCMVTFDLFVAPTLHAGRPATPSSASRRGPARAQRRLGAGPRGLLPGPADSARTASGPSPVFGKSNLIYTLVKADGMVGSTSTRAA